VAALRESTPAACACPRLPPGIAGRAPSPVSVHPGYDDELHWTNDVRWRHYGVMDITPYVEGLRARLIAAGGIGGPETVAVAERLGDSLESAARLAIQEAVCDAAEQITRDLAPGSVEVRLRSHELDFVTTLPPLAESDVTLMSEPGVVTSPTVPESEGTESGTARISFRPPEHLKARIEDAAERAGMSVNAFLVATLTAALDAPPRPSLPPGRGVAVTGWYA